MADISRILIHRLGSIGDFAISLPCLRLARRRFPEARITLLTNQPVESRAAPAVSVLDGTGLVDAYLTYPVGIRNLRRLAALRRQIAEFAPQLLIYLTERRGLWQLVRDRLFFDYCGMKHSVGMPFAPTLRHSRPPVMPGGFWEPEAQRLARCIAPLGDAAPCEAASWDLALSPAELGEADRLIGQALPTGNKLLPPLGASVGTKQAIKDWGDDNWRDALRRLGDADRPLILIGSREEHARSDAVARHWPGPMLNFCGLASPRISAALIGRCALFLCHDSGPMHLAASVGTRCVAVFSRQNPPGRWFPFGENHRLLYPRVETIAAIRPDEVAAAAREALAPAELSPAARHTATAGG